MQLQSQGDVRSASQGNLHKEGQLLMDVGEGINSGWDVKAWSEPNGAAYYPTEFHWVSSKSRNIHQTTRDFYKGGVPIYAPQVDQAIDPQRKTFILGSIEMWEEDEVAAIPYRDESHQG